MTRLTNEQVQELLVWPYPEHILSIARELLERRAKDESVRTSMEVCRCGHTRGAHHSGGCIGNRNLCECKELP